MTWTLYKLELFKAIKSLATWITFLCFLVIILFRFGTYYYNGVNHRDVYFGFPNSWHLVLTDGAYLADVFSAVLITLLIAREFDWRTSRQNVIDGLSREQWFNTKLLLLPTIVVFFYGSELVVAGTLAWLGTDPGGTHTYAISRVQPLALAGVFTGMLCYSSIALFISVITRSAGPALGFTLVYQIFENLIAWSLRGVKQNTLADSLPFQVHVALFKYDQFLPAGSAARSRLEISWNNPALFAACIAWTMFFLLAAWLVYYKRDL